MMKLRLLSIALGAVALSGALRAQGSPETYHLEKAVTIPGSATGWDYHTLDQARGRIFIAHRGDGLQVYDIKAAAFVTTLTDSKGTNTAALAPEFDLGIAGTTDGDIIVFTPSTLKTVKRYKSTTDGFDGAVYEPLSKRFVLVGEADEKARRTPVLFFDARTGEPAGTLMLDSAKVDAPRADGRGHIFLPLRDRNAVATLDAALTPKVSAMLPLHGCVRPAALELDRATQRIFVGCRGDAKSAPELAVLDAGTGKQIATLPIGHGVDEVLFDAKAQAIISANGDEGSMTVIRRLPQERYRVTATIGTRPRARTGVIDADTGKIYLVTAEYIDTYPEGKEVETAYRPDTFTVLTYAR